MSAFQHRLRSLVMAVSLSLLGHPAAGDLVSPYGGETAPSFAELVVLEDRVRVVLEIDRSEYPYYVAEEDGSGRSLAERTGLTFAVEANGARLPRIIVAVDLRPREPRPSAAALNSAVRPRSADVIRVEMEFPFDGRPQTITFIPPLDAEGRPLSSLGVLAEHMGVPVTDYRYLSRPETMIPDWNDPWFTVFENPNLTRHHASPLMSFIAVEPREVRHEIIFRLRDLEGWLDLGLKDAPVVTAAQMRSIRPRAEQFFAQRNPLVIDGRARSPEIASVSQISVGVNGLRILDDPPEVDRATALLGIMLSYPHATLPGEVRMTWDTFPGGVGRVPVTLSDPAGGVPGVVSESMPEIIWKNYLKTWTDPEVQPVTVGTSSAISVPMLSLALLILGAVAVWVAWRQAGANRTGAVACAAGAGLAAALTLGITTEEILPVQRAPDLEAAQMVMSGLLDNVRIAMLETEDVGFTAALDPFVGPEHKGSVGAEIRRGLSVSLPSGVRARTEEIGNVVVEEITDDTDGSSHQILAHWTALVGGGHWGHMHRLSITYRGLADISREGEEWHLNGLTVLSAQPAS